MNKVHLRLIIIVVSIILLAISIIIVSNVFKSNILFFVTPSQIALDSKKVRLGGMIKEGSIKSDKDLHEFVVTDHAVEMLVKYRGILPNLFKEGQGTIATGVLGSDNVFIAESLLVKHDENYIPKEIYQAMKDKSKPQE